MTKTKTPLLMPSLLLLLVGATVPVAYGQGYFGYPMPPSYYQGRPPVQEPRPSRAKPRKKTRPNHQQPESSANHLKQAGQPTPKKAAPARSPEVSVDATPEPDFSTTAALVAYTWDFADTFTDLAKAGGLTQSQLLGMNHITFSQLQDGQVLKLPAPANTAGLDIQTARQRQMAREVWRGIRGKKRVALTFDAGGEPDGVGMLIKNLKDLSAPATFFATGQFAHKNPAVIKNMASAGFPVYNHSWSHPQFTNLSETAIVKELTRTDDLLTSITGHPTKPFFRAPFGDRDSRVLTAAASEGYRSIYWTLDSLDSMDEKKDAEFVSDRVLNPPRAKSNPDGFLDGAIILMHVGEPETAKAVPDIVKGLRKRGFTLVTVEEILKP